MTMRNILEHYGYLIVLFPLLGAVANGLFGKKLLKRFGELPVGLISCSAVFLSFLAALAVPIAVMGLHEGARIVNPVYTWLQAGSLKVDISFLFDPLSAVMVMIITGIGFLIHVYSTAYMKGDPGFHRFFAYLNLFVFSMLLLVLGDSLLLMFVGWEGVGLCSYLLIGFWYDDVKNAIAGNKAFIVNRVGDLGFILGIFLLFWTLSGRLIETGVIGVQPILSFSFLSGNIHLLDGLQISGISVATIICLCLFVGATGKSAQIPLYVWLPDAMAGPTPVSALIHAATMVTAGVYMIARLNFLFSMSGVALGVIAVIGAATALMAATIGCLQNDIKKVLAYSTVSQLGYMFLAMGVGAYSAGVFHLMTHAFFKACLFLGAGSVILGMHHEQDIRHMGGLRQYMPKTFATFLIATAAIGGVPPLSGFFSKDEILWSAWSSSHGHPLLWLIGFVTAGMTAFYMSRLLLLTFFGEHRGEHRNSGAPEHALHGGHNSHGDGHHEIHESPNAITIPLIILALFAVIAGFAGVPAALGGGDSFGHFLGPVLGHHETAAHHDPMEYVLMAASVGIVFCGFGIAWVFYVRKPELPERLAARLSPVYKLVSNKYYVDEIYGLIFVSGTKLLTRLLAGFDRYVIDLVVNLSAFILRIKSLAAGWFDNAVVDGIVNLTADSAIAVGRRAGRLQTGKIQLYLMLLLLALAAGLLYRMLL